MAVALNGFGKNLMFLFEKIFLCPCYYIILNSQVFLHIQMSLPLATLFLTCYILFFLLPHLTLTLLSEVLKIIHSKYMLSDIPLLPR